MKLDKDRKKEVQLPGDSANGCFFASIVWLIVVTAFAVFLRISFLGSVAVLPVVFSSYYWFITRKTRTADYEELPIENRLYQTVDWARVSDKLRIFVSTSNTKQLPHISRTFHDVFLSDEIVQELDPEPLGLLITCYCFKSERTKFDLTLLFLSIMSIFCLSIIVFITGKQNAIAILAVMVPIGILPDIFRHNRLRREFIEYFSREGRASKCLRAADQMSSKISDRFFWDPHTGIVNRKSLYGKWLKAAEENCKAFSVKK